MTDLQAINCGAISSMLEVAESNQENMLEKLSEKIVPDYRSPLLCRLNVPDGYMYKWIRMGIQDGTTERFSSESVENQEAHIRGGWEPVLHSAHPEMPREGNGIVFKNNILCRIKVQKEIGGKVEYNFADQALRHMMGLDKENDETIESNIREEKVVKSPMDFIPLEHREGMAKYFTFGEVKALEDREHHDELNDFSTGKVTITSTEKHTFNGIPPRLIEEAKCE